MYGDGEHNYHDTMTCSKQNPDVATARKRVVTDLFTKGQPSAAFFHRFMACCTASECGRLCVNLDKESDQKPTCKGLDLYAALERPEFECPLGLF